MAKPNFISNADWQLVLKYTRDFANEEYLIAAIGWHETNWGRLGAGKIGWILGFGYFPGSTVAEKYKGLENQLIGATSMLRDHFNPPITLASIRTFSINHWKASAPTAWANSVWSIYLGLIGGIEPSVPPGEEIPEVPGEVPPGEEYLAAQIVPTDSETITHWKNTFDKIALGCSTYIFIAIIIIIIIILIVRY